MKTPRIGIILGTTRQGRFADKPATWIKALGDAREDLDFELVDLRDYPMPFFDEPSSPAFKAPNDPVAQRWAAKIAELDGFLVVTGEYNRSAPAALKNALDYAYEEWGRKPIAFLGYGGLGGARAIEHLRLIGVELQMVPIRAAVHLPFDVYLKVLREGASLDDFDFLAQGAKAMLEDLAWWARVLKPAREAKAEQKAA